MITANRKFSNSTNFDMLKILLSLQSQNNGEIVHVFKNLIIYENKSTFSRENLRNSRFESGRIINHQETTYDYKCTIQNVYIEHRYLMESKHY